MEWNRKAEFINAILVLAVSYGDLKWRDVKLNGILGGNFKRAVKVMDNTVPHCKSRRRMYIDTAIAYGAPVKGLEVEAINCEFGEKWAEVIALCYTPTETSAELVSATT